MEYRKIGKSDLSVSTLGLGCGFRDGITEGSKKVIERALELEINYLDTAEAYGASEEIIREVLTKRGESDDIVVATKISAANLHYDDVLKAVERSLKRLGRKVIDLYQLHGWNLNIPIGETMRAMERLVKEGKIRYIGLGTCNVARIKEAQEALSKAEITSNLYHYNIFDREIEGEILPYCEKNNIGIIAYSPLAAGVLTGKYVKPEDKPKIPIYSAEKWLTPLIEEANLERTLAMVEEIRKLGEKIQKTVAQIAINWILTKPSLVAITTTNSVAEIEEDVGACGWRLTKEQLTKLNSLHL